MSTNSTTTPTLTTLISNTSVNQSNNNSASLDQASKQTTLTTAGGGGLSTLKSVQSMDTTIMEELLLKQSQSYYIQNTNSASNARVSLTQAPILMQLSRQTSQTQPNSSQHSLSRQNSTQQQQQQQQQQQPPPQQQQPVATKQLQPQPTQKNLNSHYLSSGVASTNSIISTNDLKVSTTSQQNTPKPAIQQQQQQQQQQSTAMDTVLKNKPSYSLQLNEATNYSKPIIVSTSQPPPQQHQPQTQPIHPPSQSVPPILPNQSQQLQQQQQQSKPNEIHLNQQTSSMYDRSSAIKKAILNDKAKSFSEYKAYLDYLKNGTGTGLGVNTIKTFESQLEASKALNTNQFPNLTIVRPYNPNEANLIRSNNTANTTPNSNIINTNNINNNNNNNNYNNNFLNTMSMLSINSNTNNTNNNNNNIMVQALMKPIQYFPQQSQQTFSGVSQHHSQQIQPNRIKFNPQQQAFTNIKSSPLIQPSYSSFSFNPNQSYMNNSNSNPNTTNNNNNNNNRISYFPTMSQRVINKTYHPVQSNNVHPSYYHGHGF
jgi:hypothetical protein